MNDEILIICADPVPLIECPVSGAALRAFGLGQGLKSKGFTVTHAFWQKEEHAFESLPSDLVPFHPSELTDLLEQRRPRVAIFQHWPLLLSLRKPAPCPIALDLHGPLILEMAYQQRDDFTYFLRNKVVAFSKADYWTCAGYRQQHYFRAWLLAAGVDVRQGLPDVIPISLSPTLPEKHYRPDLTFVFGGLFLPWQDPSAVLTELVRQMEKHQTGQLQIFGGTHPGGEIPAGVYESLMDRLKISKRVQFMGMLTRQALLDHYLSAHVAVDLMAKNPERELAFTTRTVEYLWCGLPPLYNDYSDLSSPIARANAGWIIDLQKTTELTSTISTILSDPDCIEPRMHAARRLAAEQFSWDRTITPLQRFCEHPYRLVSTETVIEQAVHRKTFRLLSAEDGASISGDALVQDLSQSLQQMQGELNSLRNENERLRALESRLHSFLPYRIYKKVKQMVNVHRV